MTVSYGPVWNSRTGTVLVPGSPWITIVARSWANAADWSSEGSAWQREPPMVPRLRTIGSVLPGDRRVQQVGVTGQRADRKLVAIDPDVAQLVQVGDIDQRLRLGQPELHHRDQAVPCGEHPGFRPRPAQQRERVINARRSLVLKVRGNLHKLPPLAVSGMRPRSSGSRDRNPPGVPALPQCPDKQMLKI